MAASPLFGRAREVRVVDDLVDAGRERGGALLVRGEPGIGKSALLRRASRRAADHGAQVLIAAGVQAEAHLPFAGLHQLLRPVLDQMDELPAPQRHAVLAAFGMTDAAAPDPFLIALAAVDLLTKSAERAPLLLIAEDAHWLDLATSDVLAFIGRRLESDPVVLLAAARDGFETPLADAGLPELRLGGIDDAAAEALLAEHAPDLAPSLRERLLSEAAGNPLALVELPLAAGGLAGEAPLPTWLPLTTRLEQAFAARVLELPAATRILLLLAAVDHGGLLAELLAAGRLVGGGDPNLESLAPAVAAGLVEIDGPTLRFRHPLVRSSIHQSASVSQRHAAHAALAEVLAGQPDRRVWHRAASAIGRDESVARELDAAAVRAERRGAAAVAVEALERAAGLGEDGEACGDRLLRAAELAFELGRRDTVVRLLREAEPLAIGRQEQTRKTWIRESFDDGVPGDSARVVWLAEIADAARDDGDTELALNLLWGAALRSWWADPGDDARARVVDAAERVPGGEGDPRVLAILSFAAPLERGAAVMPALRKLARGGGRDAGAARFAAVAATGVGAFDEAVGFYEPSIAGLRAQGRIGLLARALALEAWSAAHLADLRLAMTAAEEGGRLARETSQPLMVATAQVAEAIVAALRGDEATADSRATAVEREAVRIGANALLSGAQLARGLTALGAGRHADAYEHLRRMYDPADLAHHRAIGCFAVADLVEAAVHSGHEDAAAAVVERFEALARLTPSPLLHGGLAYARALLAPGDRSEALFQAALDSNMTRWPFLRARIQLGYGAWLRRRRRVAESRAPLRAARQTMDALGVVPWGERARQELRASGEVSRRHAPESRDTLTAQELQIAQMAADGLTNRQIGQHLYLSHRTVSTHLYRIFPKLGIASRAELRGALTEPVLAAA